jgi:chorismate synthase
MRIRVSTAGESHGRALVAVVEGIPAGVPVTAASLDADLSRRQQGHGRGARQRIEIDKAQILAGVRFGRTIGSPVAVLIANRDWENWLDVMAVDGEPTEPLTQPRPGHADLAGTQKIGAADVRDVLERASARETAARVAGGALCRQLLAALGVSVGSYVSRIGEAALPPDFDDGSVDWEAVAASPVRCPDQRIGERMVAEIDAAGAEGDTLGGTIVVLADGLVPGVGGYATSKERLDGRLAGSIVSVPAIKAVGFGMGTGFARARGSAAHDHIVAGDGGGAPRRQTDRSGGIEGGMTTGEQVRIEATMKPIPTLMQPLPTVDLATGEPADAARERSDVVAVPAAGVVCEAEVCRVLADAYLAKFGGDALADTLAALAAYKERIAWPA